MRYSKLKKIMAMHASLPILTHKEVFSDALADLTLIENKAVHRPQGLKLASYFLGLFFAVIGFGFFIVEFSPVATLHVDMNPSFELSVNRFGRVIEMEALNDDAATIIDDVDYWHESPEDVIDSLIQVTYGATFDSESAILIGYTNGNWNDLSLLKKRISVEVGNQPLSSLVLDSHTVMIDSFQLFATRTSLPESNYEVPIYTDEATSDFITSPNNDGEISNSVATSLVSSGSEWEAMANEYEISVLKFQLITLIFYSYDTYTTQADFESLVNLSINELIILYEQRPLQ